MRLVLDSERHEGGVREDSEDWSRVDLEERRLTVMGGGSNERITLTCTFTARPRRPVDDVLLNQDRLPPLGYSDQTWTHSSNLYLFIASGAFLAASMAQH